MDRLERSETKKTDDEGASTPRSADVIHFPRDRIKRTVLAGNKVYDPGPLYPEWDDPTTEVDLDGMSA